MEQASKFERIEQKHSDALAAALASAPGKSSVIGYLLGILADVRDTISDVLYDNFEEAYAIRHIDEISGFLCDAARELSFILSEEICNSAGLGLEESESDGY